jgi:hypothetical protein
MTHACGRIANAKAIFGPMRMIHLLARLTHNATLFLDTSAKPAAALAAASSLTSPRAPCKKTP